MNVETVRDFIVQYLERLAVERNRELGIDDAFDLVGSDILDSMGFVELIASLERQFGLELDLTDMGLDELTVGGLARHLVLNNRQN